jgi:hypothetical protein
MALTEQQKQTLDTINSVGNTMGLTEEQIIRAAAIAELESTLNPNATNPNSSATGLYQYIDGSWKSSDGDRTNPVDATKRFVRDMKTYEDEYNRRNTDRAVQRRLKAMEKAGIEPTLDNYIYYRHNRDLNQSRERTDTWRRDKEGRQGEIRSHIDPDGSTGPQPPAQSFLPWWIKRSYNDLKNKATSLYKQFFNTAEAAAAPTVRIDPLMLDLDGDGIETTNVKDGAYFDHDGNGFAEQTGWAASDDGILVMDRNGDGTINDGKELFGDQTILSNGQRATNGFQALADLDSNADGKIDSNDAAFANLRVWKDIDGDGYSTTDELKSLSDVGIASINLNSTPTNNIQDSSGNTQTRTGSFEKADGTSGTIGEYNLQRDIACIIKAGFKNEESAVLAGGV